VAICASAAAIAFAVGLVLGQWRSGLLLGIGLLAGSANGYLARGALSSELDFRLTSGVRLLAMTAVAVGAAALFDIRLVIFAGAGLALSQLVLAVVAGIHMVRA
jgi:hypothetical protein